VRPHRLLLAGAACFLSFLVVAALVFTRATQGPDASLALAINHAYLGAPLNQLMILATDYGREYFWVGVVAVMLIFGDRRTKILAVELALLFVAGIIVGEVAKVALYRARPFETIPAIVLRVATDTDSSFPSGHALIVSIGAGFALALFRNKGVAILLSLEAAVVCYSRVYVGAHYPMDVLGGVVLGLAITYVGLFLVDRFLRAPISKIAALVARVFRIDVLHL
jgi:undecaprenyl-diphosphatase